MCYKTCSSTRIPVTSGKTLRDTSSRHSRPLAKRLIGAAFRTSDCGASIFVLNTSVSHTQDNECWQSPDLKAGSQILFDRWVVKRNSIPWHLAVVWAEGVSITVTGCEDNFKRVFVFLLQLIVKLGKNRSEASAWWAPVRTKNNINECENKVEAVQFALSYRSITSEEKETEFVTWSICQHISFPSKLPTCFASQIWWGAGLRNKY